MILLLQLFALYTLHCYAAYSLLLLPYDPPPTSSAPYTRYCTMPGVGGGGRGANIVKNTHYSYTASSSAGSLADFAADATNLHCMPRGSYSEVRTKKNKHFAALLGAC
jgi:hypothetical protein